MIYKKTIVLLILWGMSIFAHGMENDDIDEGVPLLTKSDCDVPPSMLVEQPSEIICRISFSLEAIKDSLALWSTCKTLHQLPELKCLVQFANQLTKLEALANANPPFFNDDQYSNLSKKLDRLVNARELMHEILKNAKIYMVDGVGPEGLKLYHHLQSNYSALMANINNPSHPLYGQLKSLKKHDFALTSREKSLVEEIAIEVGIDSEERAVPLWQRVIHTIGRNRKVVLLGTITLGVICIGGTYYISQYPPFDPHSFLSSYDSSQTGQQYSDFFYDGQNLTTQIIHDNWCLPNGKHLYWQRDRYYNCDGFTSYTYIDPTKEPPHSDSGWLKVVCNKTASEAVAFLHERCGFNFDFWYSLFNRTISDRNSSIHGVYCNPHPSNNTLVCGRYNGYEGRCSVNAISEVTLADIKQLYPHPYRVRAGLYGGFTGTLTFMFLGFLLWSWCLG